MSRGSSIVSVPRASDSERPVGAEKWGGEAAMADAAERAASTALRKLSPRRDAEDVWAAARAAAWEAMVSGRVSTWAGVHLVARQTAMTEMVSLQSWVPNWEAQRSGGRRPDGAPTEVLDDAPVYQGGPGRVEAAMARQPDSSDAPSAQLRKLQQILDELVDRLVDAGMARPRAAAIVELVVEHPEICRGPSRARRRLVEEEGLSRWAAQALVTLMLGYPHRGIPGLLERELRGDKGWDHPSFPKLMSLIMSNRPRQVSGAWSKVADPAA